MSARDDLLWRFTETEDPEVAARDQHILDFLLEANPETQQRLIDKGRLTEARGALREVLACRQLVLSEDDDARLEACTDLATLERWHRQAVTAPTVADALR